MAVTKMAQMINPEVMGDMINAKIDAQLKLTPYAKLDTSLQGVPGDTKTVPSWRYIGDAEDVAEGAEVGLTTMQTASETFTIKKAMKAVGLTQEAINSGLGNPVGQAESQLAKSIAGKVDNDVLDAVYTATLTVAPDVLVPIGYDGVVDAVTKFEDEEDGVEKVMFIHPKQEAALLKDPDFLSADKFQAGVAVNGSIGKIAGCWIKKSKKVKYDEATASYLCAIIKMEPDSAETEYTEDELPAVTIFLKKDTSVDHEWLPRSQTHEITAARYYGVALTNDAKVVLAKFLA